jgi:hypothetical protein
LIERIFFVAPLSAKQNNAHSKISLGLCAILLRLYPITANVDVKAEATPLVVDPLEDGLTTWKAGMRSWRISLAWRC